MSSRHVVVALLTLALLAPSAAIGSGVQPALASSVTLRGPAPALVTDAVPVPAGAWVARAPAATQVTLMFSLHPSDGAGLEALLSSVEAPSSSGFRHFLSSAEFDARFAPSSSALAVVERALESAGASALIVTPDALGVGATMPLDVAERLLGVRFVEYGQPGISVQYTALGTPHLPTDLQPLVVGVGGLSGEGGAPLAGALRSTELRPLARAGSEFIQSNSGTSDWYFGSDYAQAYDVDKLWPGNLSVPNATYPSKVAIATLLASGYNGSTGTTLPPWDPKVIHQYFVDTLNASWPSPAVNSVRVPVPSAPLPLIPGSFGGLNDSTGNSEENALDLEMAGSMAPGAALYNFYFNGSPLAAPVPDWSAIADDFALDLGAALNYSYGAQSLAVVSCSFGLPDLNNSLWDAELVKAAVMGVTVVAASGDQGDATTAYTQSIDGQWPVWPATAAFNDSGALSVGGVSLALAGQATSAYNGVLLKATYDRNVTGIANAQAWYDTLEGSSYQPIYAGTEGGVSSVFPEPYWQFHSAAQPEIVNESILQQASVLGRAGPDLGFPGNSTIAYVYADATGAIYFAVIEGTSVAAPVCAGLLADVVAVESARAGGFSPLGYLDPDLYRMASYYANFTGPPPTSDPFLPVTQGRNYVFLATPGWDALTGWGGLNAPLFLTAVYNATIVGYHYTGPTPLLPPKNPSPPTTSPLDFALVAAGALGAIAIIVLIARPGRRRSVPRSDPGVSWGPAAGGSAAAGSGGATFLCPYCGAVRPAEPVRCPSCGAL